MLDEIIASTNEPPRIMEESSFWVLLKELFFNKGRISFFYFVNLDSSGEINKDVKIVSWIRENIKGRWHLRIYLGSRHNLTTQVIAKFNREEDAVAFKLQWK